LRRLETGRFRTAAAHYRAGRPRYPPAFIEDVRRFCGLDRSHRLLDLGTGPGLLAMAFAPHVGSVLAVDPEPEMLRAARQAVAGSGLAIEVREGSSETLSEDWGRFRAVTMGRSFHWMDRPETLRRLDRILEPEGAVLIFNDELAPGPENAALRAWSAVVEEYSRDDLVRSERRGPEWQRHDAVLAGSAFCRVERIVQTHRATIGLEVLIHRALSMSATAESRLGPRAEAMVRDIRAALAPFQAAAELVELIEWTAIVARRPRGPGGHPPFRPLSSPIARASR